MWQYRTFLRIVSTLQRWGHYIATFIFHLSHKFQHQNSYLVFCKQYMYFFSINKILFVSSLREISFLFFVMCYVTAQINLFYLYCVLLNFCTYREHTQIHIIVHRLQFGVFFFSNDLHQRDYSSVICGFNLLFYFQFRDLLCCIGGIIGMNMLIVKIKKNLFQTWIDCYLFIQNVLYVQYLWKTYNICMWMNTNVDLCIH